MNTSPDNIQFPPLHEHDFHSNLPLLGPLISGLRRGLYALTAKWPLRVMMAQQERINQTIAGQLMAQRADLNAREAALRQADTELRQAIANLEQRQEATVAQVRALENQLREFEDRLIDQDRDWAYVTRTVADLDLKVKYKLASSIEQAGDQV